MGGEIVNFNRLEEYEELVGFLESIKVTDDNVSVTISGYYLEYSNLSDEAEFLSATISEDDIGKRIGLMATDIPEKPLVIRWPKEPRDEEPSKFWDWYMETYHHGGR